MHYLFGHLFNIYMCTTKCMCEYACACMCRNIFFPRGLSVVMINDFGYHTSTMVCRFPPGKKIVIQRPLSKSETFHSSGIYSYHLARSFFLWSVISILHQREQLLVKRVSYSAAALLTIMIPLCHIQIKQTFTAHLYHYTFT